MMFDVTFAAQIAEVRLVVKEAKGVQTKRIQMTFVREFDVLVAEGLRGKARQTLLALEEHELSAATIPMDTMIAEGKLKAFDDEVVIPRLCGDQAKAKAGKADEDGDPPTIEMVFQCEWSEAAWLFVGRHGKGSVEITLTEAQGRLPFGGGSESRTEA